MAETILTTISISQYDKISSSGASPVNHLDVFIYSDAPAPELESHTRLQKPGGVVQIECSSGPKLVAAVANAPGEFNIEALRHFDTLENIVITHDAIAADTLVVMTAQTTVEAGGECEMTLEPLPCRILIRSVQNDSGARLENPRAYLLNTNASAEIFRTSGFRPVEQIDTTVAVPLPCDVGIFTQYPGTELYCLPHDLPSATAPEVKLVLEYEADGITECWMCPCGPLKRNSTLSFDITVK